jgi:hypothetical protein
LEEREIISFGGEDASRLGSRSADQVARLAEHFTAADLKALGGYLWDNEIVLDENLVKALIDRVPPGRMADLVKAVDIDEVLTSQTGSVPDPDLSINSRGVRVPKQPKTGGRPPIEIPLSELAEQQLGPVLEESFGAGWEYHERSLAPGAKPGETLGSTIPEYHNRNLRRAFEVKRLDLAELGIGPSGEIIGKPSPRSFDALRRARTQLGGRRWNLPPGTEQNLVFNISGQGVKDATAVGKRLRTLTENEHITYDRVWVQDGKRLIPIQ